MIRDTPSWQLPNGAVYDSLNMLYDKPGMARQRMGTKNLVVGSQTAFATSIGFAYSTDSTVIEELYGLDGKAGGLTSINKTTGAATALATVANSPALVGRAIRHFGFAGFPYAPTSVVPFGSVWVAGQTTSTTFVNTANATIAANNPQITLTGADVTTNVKVGAIVVGYDGTNLWIGRVVSIDTTKLFSVWPIPTINMTVPGANLGTGPTLTAAMGVSTGGSSPYGGRCCTSFQGRVLFGGTNQFNGGNFISTRHDRRVMYSPLLTEFIALTGLNQYGAHFIYENNWPALNFFDVPGSDAIVALEPISDGELLILTTRDIIIFQGNLVTQTATTSPTITFDIYPLGTTDGCLSDLSVHRTPVGIMWAGAEGVFAYWPPLRRNPAKTGVRNLMEGKILTYWQTLVSGSNFAIHGSAYVRNHYIISGSSGGSTFSLACNLQNDTWTRLSGAGTDLFISAAQPSTPQNVFAARWWDQTGAAPSMTNGQTVRLDNMMNPYTANTANLDADNNTINIAITTRTITGDSETQKLFQRGTIRYQAAQSAGAGFIPVTAQSVLDAADITAASVRSLGSLSNTEVRTLSNATNANPIQCTTTTNHGMQTDDFVDINGVLGNLNANGRWRINRIDPTNFTLVGSIGSAAYTSGGSVKKLTETDYPLATLDAGQGASINITGTPNNFELHGIRLAVLQKPPVQSA
jgi:hypothetical protein